MENSATSGNRHCLLEITNQALCPNKSGHLAHILCARSIYQDLASLLQVQPLKPRNSLAPENSLCSPKLHTHRTHSTLQTSRNAGSLAFPLNSHLKCKMSDLPTYGTHQSEHVQHLLSAKHYHESLELTTYFWVCGTHITFWNHYPANGSPKTASVCQSALNLGK